MDSYFVRHTKAMTVRDQDLDLLWAENKVAIHYPGEGKEDSKSLFPGDYAHGSEKKAIRTLVELAENGGYVWTESRSQAEAKIGVVWPKTEVQLYSAIWTKPNDSRYEGRECAEATLKTLQLDRVKEITPFEAMSLRAARPRQGTIMRWRACGPRLQAFVEGKSVKQEWEYLSPDLQESACAEFLRLHSNPHYPKLAFLMLPVGRTLKDVDIYGIQNDGTEIFAQVTYHKKSDPESHQKVKSLKKYREKEGTTRLIYFCRCSESVIEDGVTFVPVEEVLEWIKRNGSYSNKLFSI
jgi:hypothetical protein